MMVILDHQTEKMSRIRAAVIPPMSYVSNGHASSPEEGHVQYPHLVVIINQGLFQGRVQSYSWPVSTYQIPRVPLVTLPRPCGTR